jgi:hypothetical protein
LNVRLLAGRSHGTLLVAAVCGLMTLGERPAAAQTWNPVWTSVTYTWNVGTTFNPMSTSIPVTVASIPASTAICGVAVNVSPAFVASSGSGITSLTVQVGSSVSDPVTNAFSLAFPMLASGYSLTDQLKLTTTSTYNLTVLFAANANIGSGTAPHLTAGSVKVSYCTVAI